MWVLDIQRVFPLDPLSIVMTAYGLPCFSLTPLFFCGRWIFLLPPPRQPNKGDGESMSGGSSKGGTRGCVWGSRSSRTLGASVSRCLCVSHTPPFTNSLTHPSFMLPSSFSLGPGPPSFSWFLLLPCLALALTLRITHSLSRAWLTLTAAPGTHVRATHTHTHTPTAWGHSSCTLTHTQRPCRYAPVHTCTPTHASRELLIHVPTAQPLPSFSGQGHPLDADPFHDPSYLSPCFLSHICVNARRHTHTLTWRRGTALPCTSPIIQVCEVCVWGGGVCLVR